MSVKVQVLLTARERELFKRQARADGLSLSAWLKRAGHDRLAATQAAGGFRSAEDLEAFFVRCDRQEAGREPDWEQHLEVINRSRDNGLSGT
ncbi:MAG: antitoxin [Gammaproteobacteria bacterium]